MAHVTSLQACLIEHTSVGVKPDEWPTSILYTEVAEYESNRDFYSPRDLVNTHLVSTFYSWITLCKSLNFSETQFPYLWNAYWSAWKTEDMQ